MNVWVNVKHINTTSNLLYENSRHNLIITKHKIYQYVYYRIICQVELIRISKILIWCIKSKLSHCALACSVLFCSTQLKYIWSKLHVITNVKYFYAIFLICDNSCGPAWVNGLYYINQCFHAYSYNKMFDVLHFPNVWFVYANYSSIVSLWLMFSLVLSKTEIIFSFLLLNYDHVKHSTIWWHLECSRFIVNSWEVVFWRFLELIMFRISSLFNIQSMGVPLHIV